MDDTDKGREAEIKAACLRLLARREHSQHELLDKLQLKGYSKPECQAVIGLLAQDNWQNDVRYAENYARSCMQRGYGPVYIKHQLRQQGIEAIDLDSIVQQTADSWASLLEHVYRKKYGSKPITDNSDKAKRQRFLLQRGFSQALVSSVLNRSIGVDD
jgi:regulatory protein